MDRRYAVIALSWEGSEKSPDEYGTIANGYVLGRKILANIQHVADRVFQGVNRGYLPLQYSVVMGSLIDAYGEDRSFQEWVDRVSANALKKMVDAMVHEKSGNNARWIREYIRKTKIKESLM